MGKHDGALFAIPDTDVMIHGKSLADLPWGELSEPLNDHDPADIAGAADNVDQGSAISTVLVAAKAGDGSSLGRVEFQFSAEQRQKLSANDPGTLRSMAIVGLGGLAADYCYTACNICEPIDTLMVGNRALEITLSVFQSPKFSRAIVVAVA